MNTKYPLNGRYTSLGDIVQEYGKYSQWPSSFFSNTNISIEAENEDPDESEVPEDESQEGKQLKPEKAFFWQGNNTPFIDLIYGELDKASTPYELVWFDDVYSRTKKDLNSRMYKILQCSDSSIYGFGREIRAKEIANYNDNKEYGIPFRFILPNIDKSDRYYYNYKTSSGEAVVMYALRNIIETCLSVNKDNTYKFLFGSNENNGLSIVDDDNNNIGTLYVLNTLTNENYINPDQDSSKLNTDDDNFTYFIYPSLFTYDTSILYNTNDFEKFINKKSDGYTYNNNKGIFQEISTENIEISPYAYYLLGELIWSKKHIQYPNYTTDKLPKINNIFESDNNLTLNFKVKLAQDNTLPLTIDNNLLEQTILYFVNDFNHQIIQSINTDDETGGIPKRKIAQLNDFNDRYYPRYIHPQNTAYKLLYFCKLFFDSQRFYYGYVTAMRFIRISTLSYAQEQPVLRCDLGILQIVQSIEVLSAIHDYTTALPAGPLSLDTTIRINITASVKYEGMSSKIEENFPLLITFKNILNWYTEEVEDGDDTNWIRLILPGETLDGNKTIQQGYPYNSQQFIMIKYTDPADGTIQGNSDCSLGTLKWPYNDNLLCADKNEFDNFTTYITRSVMSDTYDNNTFNNDNTLLNEAINNNISPFGNLRIHTVYSTDSPEAIQNSSYYIDVSILRCKNYYYETSQAQTVENTEINCYYNPIIKQGQDYTLPNTALLLLKVQAYNDVYVNNINKLNYDYTSFYTIPCNAQDELHSIYLTIKSQNGSFYIFASGAKELTTNTNNSGNAYDVEKTLNIEGWRGTRWGSLTENNDYVINHDTNQYSIYFLPSEYINDSNYLRISLLNVNNSPIYYVKMAKHSSLRNCNINIIPLFTVDTNIIEQNLVNQSGVNKNNFIISYILYNNNKDESNLIQDSLNFSISNISYNLSHDHLIFFKLTSISCSMMGSKINYDNIDYYIKSGNDIKQCKSFNNISIQPSTGTINVYVSFNPIYDIIFNPTVFLTDNINLNKLYYNNDNNIIINNNHICSAFYTKKIYFKNDSFTIAGKSLSSYIYEKRNTNNFIKQLKYDDEQYTFITNDMYVDIVLDNLYILQNNNIKFIDIESVEPQQGQNIVKIFLETILDANYIQVTDNDNNPITLTRKSSSNITYWYFYCAPNTNINITFNFNGSSTYSFYGIYDSISGQVSNTKNLQITTNTTIICKVIKNI